MAVQETSSSAAGIGRLRPKLKLKWKSHARRFQTLNATVQIVANRHARNALVPNEVAEDVHVVRVTKYAEKPSLCHVWETQIERVAYLVDRHPPGHGSFKGQRAFGETHLIELAK